MWAFNLTVDRYIDMLSCRILNGMYHIPRVHYIKNYCAARLIHEEVFNGVHYHEVYCNSNTNDRPEKRILKKLKFDSYLG